MRGRVRLAGRAVGRRRRAVGRELNQSRFWPSPWNASSITCVPLESWIGIRWFSIPVAIGVGVCVTVIQVFGHGVEPRVAVAYVVNEPVFGSRYVIGRPPSAETSTVRPLFGVATRSETR